MKIEGICDKTSIDSPFKFIPNSQRYIFNSFVFAKITSNSCCSVWKLIYFIYGFLPDSCSNDKERNEQNFTQFKTHARQNAQFTTKHFKQLHLCKNYFKFLLFFLKIDIFHLRFLAGFLQQ